MKTNILVSGLLWSGSSAITDLLAEYNDNVVLPGEFDEFRRPGMIADHLDCRISDIYPSNINNYIIQKVRSSALSLLKSIILPNRWNKINFCLIEFERLALLNKLKSGLFANSGDIKIELVREWLRSYQKLYNVIDYMVIDQPLLFGQHRKIWPQVFDPFKLIIVYRDPLDQFAEIIRQGHLFYHMRSPIADIYGGDRHGAFNFQIDTLKSRLIHIKSILNEHGPDKVKLIKFESLIENYDVTKQAIEQFVGLNSIDQKKRMVYFDPSKSIKNIGIYKNYLSCQEVKILTDLKAWINEMELFNV